MSKDYSAIDGFIKQTRVCVADAYNKGYKDGYKDGQAVTQQAFDAEYERGLDDAWECAISIFKSLWSDDEVFEWFKLSASEAIEKWEEQEAKQKVFDQGRACPILDDDCPYPHLGCYECEVHCVMERANKKLEEQNGNKVS